jgi:hypothetical protein
MPGAGGQVRRAELFDSLGSLALHLWILRATTTIHLEHYQYDDFYSPSQFYIALRCQTRAVACMLKITLVVSQPEL